MVPANANFAVYQGADFSDCVFLKNPDGTPLVFTYAHARMQLREDYDQPILLALTDGNGIELTPNDGKIAFTITAAQSEALNLFGDAWMYRYDLVCWNADSSQTDRVAQGYFAIFPEVSRVIP